MSGLPDAWVLATHNAGKTREIRELFRGLPVELRNAGDLDLPEPEETGSSFEANAELKAIAAATATGLPAIADDSGVAVDAARWAGEPRNFDVARRKVDAALRNLGPDVSRRGTYICVLCIAQPDGRSWTFRGEARGELVWPIRGDLGFGFEPMFLPDGFAVTYGEMTAEQRRRVNARATAMRKLVRERFGPGALRGGT